MFWRKPRVRCFNAAYGGGAFAGRAALGYRIVPVDRIVGSVGRCQDLDARFRPLQPTRTREERLARIRRLVNEGTILPPVELYKLRDEYFVVDGNHRVAVAKENGAAYMDATVVEFLPDGQRVEDRLYLERRAFEGETGLENLSLGRSDGYGRLRQEIEQHRAALGTDDLREAAADWQHRIYRPAAQAILARRLPQRLPERLVGDLYLDLQEQRTLTRHQEGRELSWPEAITRFEARHPRPTLWQRLARAWGRLEAWWRGLRAQDLPCAYAAQSSDGTIYCRRVARLQRGMFGRS